MLARLSFWVKVHICIWPSWYHCHSLSLAPLNPDWFYLSGTGSPGLSRTKSRGVHKMVVVVVVVVMVAVVVVVAVIVMVVVAVAVTVAVIVPPLSFSWRLHYLWLHSNRNTPFVSNGYSLSTVMRNACNVVHRNMQWLLAYAGAWRAGTCWEEGGPRAAEGGAGAVWTNDDAWSPAPTKAGSPHSRWDFVVGAETDSAGTYLHPCHSTVGLRLLASVHRVTTD